MNPWLMFLSAGLFLAVLILSVKILMMKKSARGIERSTKEKLENDTNTLISISSSDKDMKALASSLNSELRILREKRQKYVSGDAELKNAVTNISHDLRTPLTAICGYLDLLEKEEQTESGKRYLKIIRERTSAMRSLTQELFGYSNDTVPVEESLTSRSPSEYFAALFKILSKTRRSAFRFSILITGAAASSIFGAISLSERTP